MTKFINYIIGLVLLLALIIGGALLALYMILTPAKLKVVAESQLTNALHRNVVLKSNPSWTILPSLGIRMHDVEIANPQGFPNTPFLKINSLHIAIKLSDLIHGKVSPTVFNIDGAKVYLIRKGKAVNWDWNKQNLPATGIKATVHSTLSKSVTFNLAHLPGFAIKNVDLQYLNEETKSILRVRKLQLTASELDQGSIIPIDFGFDVGGNRVYPIKGRVGGKGTIEVDHVNHHVRFKNFTVSANISSERGHHDPAILEMKGDVLLGRQTMTGEIDIAKFTLREFATLFHIRLPSKDLDAFSMLSGKIPLKYANKTLSLEGLDIKFDDTVLRGSFSAILTATPGVIFSLQSNRLDLTRYLVNQEDEGEGKPAPKANPSQAAQSTQWTVKGDLEVGELLYDNLVVTNAKIALEDKEGQYQLTVKGGLYGGLLQSENYWGSAAGSTVFATNTKLMNVNFAPILQEFAKTDYLSGQGDVNIALRTSGRNKRERLQNLTGQGELTLVDGEFRGLDITQQLIRLYAVLKQKPETPLTPTNKTLFSRMNIVANIAGSRAVFRPLSLIAPAFETKGQGVMNLQTLDTTLHLTLHLKNSHSLKATPIPLTLNGKFPYLKPMIDFDEALKFFLKGTGKTILEGGMNAIKNTIQGIPDNLPIPPVLGDILKRNPD